ncbi:MAG: DUF4157 domain-containing protein [Nitrospira sp.]|nr:DUF4157 domain-containing protein [Nitrospira sp.]
MMDLAIEGLPLEHSAEAAPTPSCRFDSSLKEPVRVALDHALEAFKLEKISLRFSQGVVNSDKAIPPGWVAIEVVKDATLDDVDSKGCHKSEPPQVGQGSMDQISVRGGCYVSGEIPNLIRCSSTAVEAFRAGTSDMRPESPALLYVLAHELAHLYQNRRGEFSGKIETIDLQKSKVMRLQQLEQSCAPGLITKEEEADDIALRILKRKLPAPPYRETVFSAKGSMYWNIDRIRLAANEWNRTNLAHLNQETVPVHDTFNPNKPISLPATPRQVKATSKRFLCDVLKPTKRSIRYPVRQSTHPSAEARLRKIADVLSASASGLSDSDGSQIFHPIAQLQESVSPIFAFIDREFGIYVDNVHSEICSAVNGELVEEICR